jgi:molecular chaperone HscA
MARLEMTFNVDTDGLLSVHAKELTTGIEQQVAVKPSYGLDDTTVERMLLEALDHGEHDLTVRLLAENKVEASRILAATRKALEVDADLLEKGEKALIEQASLELEQACDKVDASRIRSRIEALDDATKTFAGRRMNRAIARAIEGKRVDAVEKTVEHAKGIEAAHAAGATRAG